MRIRNYSENPIRSYVAALSGLSKHYKASPGKLSNDQFKDYAYYLLEEKQFSNSTINQLISAWKILQVDILGNAWENFKLKRPRRQKAIPEVLSQKHAIY